MNNKPYVQEINDLQNKCAHYFAAANTYKGFESFFDEIFNTEKLERIYILKGGPGAGKSTLMKKAALTAQSKGLTPTCFHCSSDPLSLDGVVIKEMKTAILDGTAPHVFDPKYAGAKEIIVNLGEAWNLESLARDCAEIVSLTSGKSKRYRAAYRLLDCAKSASDELTDIGRECLDIEKMKGAVNRFCEKTLRKGDSVGSQVAIADAISCDGLVRFFTPEKQAESLYFVKDAKNTAPIFFKELEQKAILAGVETIRGICPLDPKQCSFLYFPARSVCVSMYDDDFCKQLEHAERQYKIINLGRFFNTAEFRKSRERYRFIEKCKDALMAQACKELEQAGKDHAQLEKIYAKATDYEKISYMSADIISKMFK